MRNLFLGALFLFAFSTGQAAERKTMAEYWKEVDLRFTLFEGAITSENCYSKLTTFLGCVHGLNAVLGHAKKPLSYVPTAHVKAHPRIAATVETAAPVSLVELGKPPNDKTLLDAVTRMKKERNDDYLAWKAIFDSTTVKIDFAPLAKRTKELALGNTASEAEVTASGINGYLSAADDAHTHIQPKKYFEDEQSSSEQSFVGIGVRIREVNASLVISQPYEGGPAHKAGVKAKDVITHVNGTEIHGLAMEDSMKLLKGEKGTEVTIRVKRKNELKEFKIVRDNIVTKNVEARMLTDDRKSLGYVKLGDFVQGDPGAELKKVMEELLANKPRAWVFDLRGNPGGLLLQAVTVANLFIEKEQKIVSQKALKTQRVLSEAKTQQDRFTDLPLVTLVDGGSASASEIVAGALQDLKRGLIVGERSYGKGSVQSVRNFTAADGVLMVRTEATFHLQSGRSNQILGIIPDLFVYKNPNPTDEDKFSLREEDTYMNALPSTSEPFKTLQPELVASVTKCIAKTGQAKQRFERGEDDAIPPDYQLLYAQDAAACLD